MTNTNIVHIDYGKCVLCGLSVREKPNWLYIGWKGAWWWWCWYEVVNCRANAFCAHKWCENGNYFSSSWVSRCVVCMCASEQCETKLLTIGPHFIIYIYVSLSLEWTHRMGHTNKFLLFINKISIHHTYMHGYGKRYESKKNYEYCLWIHCLIHTIVYFTPIHSLSRSLAIGSFCFILLHSWTM